MSFSKNTKSFAYPVLVADIGGTNARFALVDDAEAPTRMCGKTTWICSARRGRPRPLPRAPWGGPSQVGQASASHREGRRCVLGQ